MTMENFINDGYLIKALDLPEEYADSILQPTFTDEPVKIDEEAIIDPNFKPRPERLNQEAPITLIERIA